MKRVYVPVTLAILFAYLTSNPVIGTPPQRDQQPTFNALPKSGASNQALGRMRVNSGAPELDNSAGRASFRSKAPAESGQRPDAGREFRSKTAGAPGLLANAPVQRTAARTASSGSNLQHNAVPKAFARNAASSTQAPAKQVGSAEVPQLLVRPGTTADIDKSR
jgi:hypothetical protein